MASYRLLIKPSAAQEIEARPKADEAKAKLGTKNGEKPSNKDAEKKEEQLRDLQKTRLAIHTFDRSDFLRASEATGKTVAELKAGTAKTWAEYRFRRNGLLLATAFISVFALLLWLKIRQVDRETGFRK